MDIVHYNLKNSFNIFYNFENSLESIFKTKSSRRNEK